MPKERTCANCRWLSEPKATVYGHAPHKVEETRLVCLQGVWRGGSVQLMSFHHNERRYDEIAEKCPHFSR